MNPDTDPESRDRVTDDPRYTVQVAGFVDKDTALELAKILAVGKLPTSLTVRVVPGTASMRDRVVLTVLPSGEVI